MFLLIDNYDSFTFNLAQNLQQLSVNPRVIRNDRPELLGWAHDLALQGVIISPGPGSPVESGLCIDFLERLSPQIPVLGICLGHQILAHYTGYTITRADRIMHGKTSLISHQGSGLFRGMTNPFRATRYHSLIMLTDPPGKDSPLQITAWSEFDEPMGLCFRDRPWMGLQFHPESILTPEGPRLLANFIFLCGQNRMDYPIYKQEVPDVH